MPITLSFDIMKTISYCKHGTMPSGKRAACGLGLRIPRSRKDLEIGTYLKQIPLAAGFATAHQCRYVRGPMKYFVKRLLSYEELKAMNII